MKPIIVKAEAVASWSASKINEYLERLDQRDTDYCNRLLCAGRGYEKPSETRQKHDDLSRKCVEVWDAKVILRREVERRYGPGAPHRLPKGFGPIKGRF